MPWVIKRQQEWCQNHGELDLEKGGWVCKETGAPINFVASGRSIWFRQVGCGGAGEVRQVYHLYCRACNPNFKVPQYGFPIFEDELIQVRNN